MCQAKMGTYSGFHDLDADMNLMVDNAHQYNTPDSQVRQRMIIGG